MQDMRRSVKQQHGLASVASLHALGLYVHLHCLVTDGAYEEQGDELHFLAAAPPTPERMTAVRAADDDLDPGPALAACSSRSPARTSRPAHSPRRRR